MEMELHYLFAGFLSKQEGSHLILYLTFSPGFNLALIPAVRLNSLRGDKLKTGILARFSFFFKTPSHTLSFFPLISPIIL